MKKPLILASQSPRRIELVKMLGYSFEVKTEHVEEIYPPQLHPFAVPEFLACSKAKPVLEKNPTHVVVAADTIVVLEGKILGKPVDLKDASTMLEALSGKMHTVVTGVCIASEDKIISFTDTAQVYFNQLSDQAIEYYLQHFPPLDKAGAYGVQDWMGLTGIRQINGSFYTVMGLPIDMLHAKLLDEF
jgi:septum formation protein